MNNPYAPPGDRPAAPPGASAGDPDPEAGGGAPQGSPGRPHGPVGGAPHRSPEGVPYERSRRPRGPAPHPTDVRRVAVLTRTTALLVLFSVLAGLFPFPWHLAAVPLALAAIVVGGRTMTVASRTRVRGTSLGVVGLLLIVALLGLARPAQTALMWDVEKQYAQCLGGALTVQAQNGCVSRYEQATVARVQELQGRP